MDSLQLVWHAGRRTAPLAWASLSSSGISEYLNRAFHSSGGIDRYKTPPKSYVQLLQHIALAKKLTRLEELTTEYAAKFDAVHAAAALTRLPKLLPPAAGAHPHSAERVSALLTQLQGLIEPQVPRFHARQIANCVWALGKLKPYQTPETRRLSQQLLQELSSQHHQKLFQGGRPQDVAQLLNGLGHLKVRRPALLKAVSAFTQRQLCGSDAFEAKHVTNVAWGFARLGHADAALFDALAEQAVHQRQFFRPRSMAVMLWACTQANYRNPELFAALSEVAQSQMRSFTPRDLAILTAACARLHFKDEALLDAVSARALECLNDFDARPLGLLLRGLARLQHHAPPLLEAVATGIASEVAVNVAPSDVTRIAFGFSRFQISDGHVHAMLDRLTDAVMRRMPLFRPQALCELAASLSKLQYSRPVVLDALAAAAAALPDTPDNLRRCSRMLGSYNRLDNHHPVLGAAADARLRTHAEVLSCTDAVDAAHQLAQAQSLTQDTADAVVSAVAPQLDKLSSREIAVLLQSCAAAGHIDAAFFTSAAQAASQQPTVMSPLALSSIPLSISRAQTQLPELAMRLYSAARQKLVQFSRRNVEDLVTALEYNPAGGVELAASISQHAQSQGWEDLRARAQALQPSA